AEDGIRDLIVTGVQTCALPIFHLIAAAEPDGGRLGDRPDERGRIGRLARAGVQEGQARRGIFPPGLEVSLLFLLLVRRGAGGREDRKSTRRTPVTIRARMPSSA